MAVAKSSNDEIDDEIFKVQMLQMQWLQTSLRMAVDPMKEPPVELFGSVDVWVNL